METESYVYKKEVDWSVLMEGFTLPIENQVVFLQNMGRFLQRGESKIIHFYMEGKTYDVKIININNSVEKRKKDAYQIRYTRNGEFSQALQVGFKRSMDYIRAIRESRDANDRRYIKVPVRIMMRCLRIGKLYVEICLQILLKSLREKDFCIIPRI